MRIIKFPSKDFVKACDDAILSGAAFQIVVPASSGKVGSVRRSIAEMRGEKSQTYQLLSLCWDKPRTMGLWVGLARAVALDCRLELVLDADLIIDAYPPASK